MTGRRRKRRQTVPPRYGIKAPLGGRDRHHTGAILSASSNPGYDVATFEVELPDWPFVQ